MADKICDQVIYIFIDPGSNYSYVNPDLVVKCGLRKEVNAEFWLVQLATGMKKSVHHWIIAYAFELNCMHTTTYLNLQPLESYNMILGMNWMYLHRTKVDFYERAIECMDDNGEKIIL